MNDVTDRGAGAELTDEPDELESGGEPRLSMFRRVPRTGVIYVTVEAQKRGFELDAPGWCNLGQGQPETENLEGAPPRIESVAVHGHDLDYAPVPGIPELREAVADLYNDLFRRGKKSKYSAENVAICGGGRVSIMRTCATIAPIHLGHFLPDYTAYEELLDVFRRFQSVPILLDPARGYELDARTAGDGDRWPTAGIRGRARAARCACGVAASPPLSATIS